MAQFNFDVARAIYTVGQVVKIEIITKDEVVRKSCRSRC